MTPPADRAAGRTRNSRPKTDPTCPIPEAEKHNSVRAARSGCTCTGALIAQERTRDLDRTKSKARKQRDAEERVADKAAARIAQQRRRARQSRDARHLPSPLRSPRADARLPHGMHLRPATELEKQLRARDDLACRHEDPELFHPVGTGAAARAQEVAAKRVCGRCPAIDICATVSLQMLPVGTVLGGFSDADRRNLRAKGWAA